MSQINVFKLELPTNPFVKYLADRMAKTAEMAEEEAAANRFDPVRYPLPKGN